MAEDIDKKELAKLSPETRIKKLKELEEKRKKEIEEAEKLIKESVDEIRREDIAKKIKAPEPEEIDIRKIFEEQESLEDTVRGQQVSGDIESRANDEVSYIVHLYDELAELREEAQDGYLNRQRAEDIYNKIIETSYHSQDSVAKEIAHGSRRMIREIMGDYHASQDYRP